MRANGCEK